jgi:hypothetical protein
MQSHFLNSLFLFITNATTYWFKSPYLTTASMQEIEGKRGRKSGEQERGLKKRERREREWRARKNGEQERMESKRGKEREREWGKREREWGKRESDRGKRKRERKRERDRGKRKREGKRERDRGKRESLHCVIAASSALNLWPNK